MWLWIFFTLSSFFNKKPWSVSYKTPIKLNTMYNLYYYLSLMQQLCDAIENRRLDGFVQEFYQQRGLSVSKVA